MAVSITFYTFYLAIMGFIATLLSEYTFHTFTRLRLVRARAELEAAIIELRSISRDKRGQRKRGKLAAKINMMYSMVRRYTLYRTMLLLGFYTAAVLASISRQVLIPSRCPIPFITAGIKTPEGLVIPVTSSAIILALSFLSSIFMVREDVVGLLMLKILQRRSSKK